MPAARKQRMRDAARDLRKNPTSSEAVLWQALRGNRLDGRKFRRQQAVGPFVVDFYCASERLVVEVDGGIHEEQREKDAERQSTLERLGLRFIRISHERVIDDLQSALNAIRLAFASSAPLPPPSPPVGEGSGVGGTAAREAIFDDPALRWMLRQQKQEVAR